MTTFPYRKHIVAVALGGALLHVGGWYLRDAAPMVRELEATEAVLEEERAATRAAKQASLRLGEDGLQAEIERLTSEVERRQMLAPQTSDQAPEAGALQIRDQIGLLARRYGVDASQIMPVEPTSEGGVRTDGFRVRVTGPYHSVGAMMTDLVSLSRLTRVSDVRLVPVPDTLIAGEAEQARELSRLVGTAGRPLDAVVEFTLNWYWLDESNEAAPVDSEASAVEGAEPPADSFDPYNG